MKRLLRLNLETPRAYPGGGVSGVVEAGPDIKLWYEPGVFIVQRGDGPRRCYAIGPKDWWEEDLSERAEKLRLFLLGEMARSDAEKFWGADTLAELDGVQTEIEKVTAKIKQAHAAIDAGASTTTPTGEARPDAGSADASAGSVEKPAITSPADQPTLYPAPNPDQPRAQPVDDPHWKKQKKRR